MKHVPQKIIITVIVLLAMLFGSLMITGLYDIFYHTNKELDRRVNQLDTLAMWIPGLEEEEISSSVWFEENTNNTVRIMQASLKELVETKVNTESRVSDDDAAGTQDDQAAYTESRASDEPRVSDDAAGTQADQVVYIGPRVFDDGVVVEVRDGQIIYPEDLPEEIVTDNFRKCVENMLLREHEKQDEAVISDIFLENDEETYLILTAGEILDNVFYIDWTPEREFYDYIKAHSKTQEVLETAASAYGGILILVTDIEEPEMPLHIAASSSGITDPEDPDLLRDLNELDDEELDRIS